MINDAVQRFRENLPLFDRLAENLQDDLLAHPKLRTYIHFAKWRVKDPDHLADKLTRKVLEAKAKGRTPTITAQNLFTRVTDLAGVRLLHLHTEQMRDIAPLIQEVLAEHRYRVKSGPVAHCWDADYEALFRGFGIRTEKKRSMYTSVHYVIAPNKQYACEIQVRTLMEEVWGEIDHAINYPTPSKSVACREQIRALARATSSCSRLVDSIVASHEDHLAHDH